MSRTLELYGLEDWSRYLAAQSLPVRVSTLVRLKRALANDRTTLAQLGQLISRDPVLSLHVARLAQERHAAKGGAVTSLDHAIATLGMNRLDQLAGELDTIRLHPHCVAQRSFFRAIAASSHAATQAADWVRYKRLPYVEEARLAALFYGLAHWLLWLYAPLHKERFLIAVIEDNRNPVEVEREIFGCSTQEIGKALADCWQLTELTLQALDHDTSPSLTMLKQLHLRALKDPRLEDSDLRELNHLVQQHYFPVKLSNWMSLTVSRGWNHPRAGRMFDIISDYLDLPLGETLARLHRNCVHAAQGYHVPGVMMPAAELLLLPGGDLLPHRLTEEEQRVYARRYPQPVEPPTEAMDEAESTEPLVMPEEKAELLNPYIFDQELERLRNGYELYTKPAHILQGLLQGLHRGLGLERVALWLVRPRSRQLSAVRVVGEEVESPLAELQLDLDRPGLLSRLCQKPAMLAIDEENRAQIQKALPVELRGWLGADDCLLMSIFRGQSPLAVIYADRMGTNRPLTTFHREHFRSLCVAATLALNSLPAGNASPEPAGP